jgi:predicted small integral membrane protein
MNGASSLLVFKLVLTTGLALWMTTIVVNNLTAFRSGVLAIGGLMSMQLFDQEPAIKSPLLARRIESHVWHRLTYTLVLIVQTIVGLLLWSAAVAFAGVLFGAVDVADATIRANLALVAFLTLGFVLALGGAWFAYYVRQEGMQITHFVLIVIAIAAAAIVNIPAP